MHTNMYVHIIKQIKERYLIDKKNRKFNGGGGVQIFFFINLNEIHAF